MGCEQSQVKPQINAYSVSKDAIKPNSRIKVSLEDNPPRKSFSALLEEIQKQLIQSEYGQLLNVDYVKQVIREARDTYLSVEERHSMLELLLDYMAFCKNETTHSQALKTKLNNANFIARFAERWLKLKNEVYFSNNDTLKILAIIASTPNADSPSYFNLKFDFSSEEMLEMAKTVKEFCRYDLRAFSFLSNYLLKCCMQLEKEGSSLEAIEQRLVAGLELIAKEHPPAPPLSGEEELFLKHQSLKQQLEESERVSLDLSQIPDEERERTIEEFIESMAMEAGRQYSTFVDLIKDACTKQGYHFKSGLKLKSLAEKRSLERIKEKMLDKSFQKFIAPKEAKWNLSQYISAEEAAYKKGMQSMYAKLTGKVDFKVSDLLRAKCMFASIDKINECCSELRRLLGEKGIKIVELDNRLRGKTGTSDVVLKILVGRTVAELQLVIDLNIASYEFSHKIYEITRSKFYTPLTMLKVMNEQLSLDYFAELARVIAINASSRRTSKYQERLTYQQVQGSFQQFLQLLPFTVIVTPQQELLHDFNQRLKIITATPLAQPITPSLSIHKNNTEFKIILKEYQQALSQSNTYKTQMEAAYPHLLAQQSNLTKEQQQISINYANGIRNMGRIYQYQGLNDKAINCYQKSIEVILGSGTADLSLVSKLEFNIAWLEYKKCNYEKALQCYNRILVNQETNIGKENLQYASTLNNIGLIFYSQNKFAESLQVYEQSLLIREKLLGKCSMECTSTLNNIGLVYNNMGSYAQAVMYFQRCLEIKEKFKGRESTDCALTLNNIGMVFSNQGRLKEALSQYKRSLEIREAIKGPQNIDCAITLSNIALSYLRQGEMKMAHDFNNRSLSIRLRAYGEDNIECVANYVIKGDIFFKQGKFKEARKELEKAEKIALRVKGADSIRYATILLDIGLADIEDENFNAAQIHIQTSYKIISTVEGEKSTHCSACYRYWGILYMKMNKLEQAESSIGKALQFFKTASDYNKINNIELYVYLGRIQLLKQNLPQAKSHFQNAISICLQTDYCYEFYAEARRGLGDIYSQQHNYAAAISQYENAAPILKKFNGRSYGALQVAVADCLKHNIDSKS